VYKLYIYADKLYLVTALRAVNSSSMGASALKTPTVDG
jgi:hypothetical protein